MKSFVVFFTDFNTRQDTHLGPKGPKHPAVSGTWLTKRFLLWKETCWKSIQRQTSPNWMYVMRCHSDAKRITDSLFSEIRDNRFILSYIYTGQEIIIIDRLSKLAESLYMVRIDSDDMYHEDVAAELYREKRNNLWFYWKRGYALNYVNKDLYAYDVRHCGPFFAHKYLDLKAFSLKKSLSEMNHSQIKKKCPVKMQDGKFIVGLTDMNTTTRIGLKNIGGLVPAHGYYQALKGFPDV